MTTTPHQPQPHTDGISTFEWLKATLKEVGVKGDITESASLCDDLGMDSLDLVELLFRTEDEFGEIDDEQAERCLTIGDVIRLIDINKSEFPKPPSTTQSQTGRQSDE